MIKTVLRITLTGIIALCPVLFNPAQAEDFALTGRVSVRHENNAYQSNLAWDHADSNDRLILTTPLGQGIATLERDAEGAILRLPNGREWREETLDVLAGRLFSTPLPIASLADWICGIAPHAVRDDHGRPQSLLENGWQVTWLRYDAANKPQLLTVEGDNLVLRLLIDEREITIQPITLQP